MIHYIFGYGSLIDTQNRSLTLPHIKEVFPLRVQGLQREWNVPSILRSFTVLGVRPCAGASCTGIIFPVSDLELEELDVREQKYDRIELAHDAIEGYSGKEISGAVYTYIPQFPQQVNREYPLAQTYLDIVLRGCLEFGDGFARDFIQTTKGWSEYWVNDRMTPRMRKMAGNSELEQRIDRMLAEQLPAYFSQRI